MVNYWKFRRWVVYDGLEYIKYVWRGYFRFEGCWNGEGLILDGSFWVDWVVGDDVGVGGGVKCIYFWIVIGRLKKYFYF